MRSAAEAAPAHLHLPQLAGAPERFELPAEEARYVARVVRARAGGTLRASDGAGTLAVLELEVVRPAPVVRVVSRRFVAAPEPRVLLCGAPEGERGDWLVEKLAELGVTRLAPVDTARDAWPAGDRSERWRRLAVAALRQSRSAWLMAVSVPAGLEQALAALEGLPGGGRWLAEPGGGAPRSGRGRGPLAGAVGGAGGFTPGERRRLEAAGFESVALARCRLRAETAAVAMAALWAAGDAAAGSEA
jgi:16S rRNA (uracil1498-N3)-methyltransferase